MIEIHNILNEMIEHNKNVEINNLFIKHLNISYDNFKNLPNELKMICPIHFEEYYGKNNCSKCNKNYIK